MPELVAVDCPYCGEPIELMVDASEAPATYIEDCPVCCRPMQVETRVEDGRAAAEVRNADA